MTVPLTGEVPVTVTEPIALVPAGIAVVSVTDKPLVPLTGAVPFVTLGSAITMACQF